MSPPPYTAADLEVAREIVLRWLHSTWLEVDVEDSARAELFEGIASAIAAEREECAKVCIKVWKDATNEPLNYERNAIGEGCYQCAAAIRARGASTT